MDNGNHSPLQQTECDKTLLSIIVAIILNCHDIAIKHGWNINEIYSVLTKISKTLCFISFILHNRTTATIFNCSYKLSLQPPIPRHSDCGCPTSNFKLLSLPRTKRHNGAVQRLQTDFTTPRSPLQSDATALLAERRTDRPSAPSHPQPPECLPPHTLSPVTASTPVS